jgi:hypothetical protein
MNIRLVRGCGKPLWKKLWKVWKSQGFQQVFCLFDPRDTRVENASYGLHNSSYKTLQIMLRHHRKEVISS